MKTALIVIACVLAVFAILSMVMLGVYGGMGPLGFIKENRMARLPGNAQQYHLENVEPKADSPLQGEKALFLGSSVTYGAASLHVSMADYIGKLDGVEVTKEAVSGTTLSTAQPNSYVERLQKVDTGIPFDFIVVQLSTNDASRHLAPGELTDSTDLQSTLDSADTTTITGAIEYIIAYCRKTWGCPVIFYTGTKYNSDLYAQMVDRLHEIQEKWNIGVIDLWNDTDMNAVSQDNYNLYMSDRIHPTQAGYLLWWTPKMEEYLYTYLAEQR